MKKIIKYCLLAIVLVISSFRAFGQKEYQDTIYLKNGESAHGKIIEIRNNKSVEIMTPDKMLLYFNMDEVEKIIRNKEPKNQSVSIIKGYLGISGGPSKPLIRDFNPALSGTPSAYMDQTKSGAQVALDFGILLSRTSGISVSYFISAYSELTHITTPHYVKPYNDSRGFNGLVAGPFFVFPIANKLTYELRPAVGYISEFTGNSFCHILIDFGNRLNLTLFKRLSLFLGADIMATGEYTEDSVSGVNEKIRALSIEFGIAFGSK